MKPELYNKSSGEVYYEIYEKRPIISFLNQLHNNQEKGWIYIADIYAFILTFLEISGLVIVKFHHVVKGNIPIPL